MKQLKPYGEIDPEVFQDPAISVNAKALYGLLCTFIDKEGKCWTGHEELGKCLKVSKKTIGRYMEELESAGVVKRNQIIKDNGDYGPYMKYVLHGKKHRGEVTPDKP